MKVLSLFDGMACGMLAMIAANVNVERYVAFEIDKYAVQTATHNFPIIEQRGDVFTADVTEFSGFDYLVGGSPCTYWSIAQKNNRETEASGMGWELFCQYVRALHEAKPRYFIYENNKSMSDAIRKSITQTFGFDPIHINSALVSAQNRHRLYWVGRRNNDGTYSKVNVEQPENRGILLRHILERDADELSYEFASYGVGYRNRRESDGKLYRRFESHGEEKANALTTVQPVLETGCDYEYVFKGWGQIDPVPSEPRRIKHGTAKGNPWILPKGKPMVIYDREYDDEGRLKRFKLKPADEEAPG